MINVDTNKIDHPVMVEQILNFTRQEVAQFLAHHPNETFYAFAFDCNAEYGELNLCFNTETEFQKMLSEYYPDRADNQTSPPDYNELKFNTGNWGYQCFATLYVMSEDKLCQIYSTDINRQVNELMIIFTKAIIRFKHDSVYQSIAKSTDFRVICIDHDENIIDATQRFIEQESIKQ